MQNILIIIFIALSVVNYSCSDSTRAQNAPISQEVLDKNELREAYLRIDGLQSELSSLRKNLEKQQNTINEQQKEIKRLKEKKSEMSLNWVIWALTTLILILISIYFYITIRNIKSRLDKHRYYIDKLINKIEEYKSKSYINISTSKPFKNGHTASNDNYKPIEEKPFVPTVDVTKDDPKPIKNIKETKEGYFGMLIGSSYFKELITSKNDNALFKAWVSDTEGEFTVLSLDAIRSIDGIENAVYKEGVPIKDALDFKVIQNGKVKRDSKGNWNIISPTKIKLS